MLTRLLRALKPEPPSHIDLVHGDKRFRIQLKRAPTARKFTLRVRAATRDIVMTMPLRGSFKEAQAFAQRYAGWIDTRFACLPQQIAFIHGATIPLRGIAHSIAYRPGLRRTVWVERNASPDVAASMLLCVSGASAHVERRVLDYLKREARSDLEAAVAHHTKAIGKAARKLTLRDQASRWGSCSSTGSLSFSWRLILAPAFVLDYLAAHEVAHLVHMDHSARFWKLTASLIPDFERAEAWLKANGAGLHRYGGSVDDEAGAAGT